ncbi:MAG TPA: S1 RNA-binding domain-containing protein [Candidatus Saccharimonadales bacterium]|nr:S1 RNA-binding domain-containing protein [Candidatus Saccharimonadales bacterium]
MNPLPPSDPEPDPDSEAEPAVSDFARALEEFEHSARSAAAAAGAAVEVQVGARVRGKVVHIGEEHTLVDFGGRSEAVVETRQYRAEDGTLRVRVGDELDLFVVETGDQVVLAPAMRADAQSALRQMREAHAAGMPVAGRVTGVNAGGLEVDVGGARGFCPVSQIESGFCADPSAFVGRTLEFLVTEIRDGRSGVVLSRRQLLRREEEERARELLSTLRPGDERAGTVSRLDAFGAFVDLGGVEGLVHISEIRHEHVGHPREVLQEGERVRVRVLRIQTGRDGRPRISLSIKAAAPDPWEGIEARLPRGTRVQGVVARVADFGAFVTLAPGVDGLIHISEVALHRVAHVREVLAVGQTVEAVVLDVDPARKRISLSIREAQAAGLPPAREPAAGEVTDGLVGAVKPYGVFVDLPEYGPRASGLLPREETGEPRGADLARAFAVGQPLRVEILEVKEGKIRLGLTRAQPPESQPEAAVPAPTPTPAAAKAPPKTALALALQKAMEESQRKRGPSGGGQPAP